MDTSHADKLDDAHRTGPMPVRINRDEAAFLLNVLADNARPWNARLRSELGNFVSPTDAHNAKLRLLGRAPNPEENEAA